MRLTIYCRIVCFIQSSLRVILFILSFFAVLTPKNDRSVRQIQKNIVQRETEIAMPNQEQNSQKRESSMHPETDHAKNMQNHASQEEHKASTMSFAEIKQTAAQQHTAQITVLFRLPLQQTETRI